MDDCTDPKCGTCNRVNIESLDVSGTGLTTYYGEYAVVTRQAPELDAPGCMAAYRLGLIKHPAYITIVGFVGCEEASVNESIWIVEDSDFYRYWVRHDNPDNLEDAHQMVVASIKDGLIDITQSRGDEYMKERDDNLDRLKREAKEAIASGGLGFGNP